ncbi:glycosyltransferase family 4 protein [Vibrio sp. VB16]|uniref:glycosyltransferase family 4 protein n=1 Tax=Vibrio sp. VB16 TaxID=2785746 RepID=UPI00189E2B9D|nr:glycosyltransferase family 4 protein [Vibrio sp. VB16]UGA54995.1 glycosyltransferase family 4 protein [Vibrio sp. VB16]
MKNKKVIWIINQYASTLETGMGGRHYYFSREFAKEGHNVYLIGASYHHLLTNPETNTKPIESKEVDGFKYISIDMPRYSHAHSKKRVLGWFRFSYKICKLRQFIEERPDVIIVSTPSLVSVLGAKYLARKYSAKLIWDIRDIWPLTLTKMGSINKRHPFIQLLQYIENFACKHADYITSNWPYANHHLEKRGLEKDNFTWIPNGFSIEEFEDQDDLDTDFLKNVPKSKFLVVYTGTLGKANAIDVLLDVAELLKNNENIVFLVVGGGKDKSEFELSLQSRNLDNVLYLGTVRKKQIPSVLALADLCYVGFRKSSLYEYGNSLNKLPEYLASGKPIVYSVSSPYKPVDIAKAGITVPAEDPIKISSAIVEISRMPKAERQKLGRNGYLYAVENFEYRVLAKKFLNIIEG